MVNYINFDFLLFIAFKNEIIDENRVFIYLFINLFICVFY